MRNILNKLYSHICKFKLNDGINETVIPYIKIYKQTDEKTNFTISQNPLYIVSGSIYIHDEKKVATFSEGYFLVPHLYRPISVTINKYKEFLSIILTFRADDIISVLLDIDENIFKYSYNLIESDKLLNRYSAKISNILIRIFEQLGNIFMINHIKKELIYEIIHSPYGKIFIENTLNTQISAEIFNINSWIKQNYKDEFSVEYLALQANMSVSNFHQKFKAAVGMGPIQCQKKLRLVEARRLMLDESVKVTSYALEVGYESISQFISDYRRMFGYPPQKDIQAIRKRLITGTDTKRSS